MKSLFIQYTVLFSKLGLTIPAMQCAKMVRHYEPCAIGDNVVAIMDSLLAEHAPSWLVDNFTYHMTGAIEKLHVERF